MTQGEFDVWRTCPKTPYGAVINPKYAERPWAEGYIREWGNWCRAHAREDWPDYIQHYVADRKREAIHRRKLEADHRGNEEHESADGRQDLSDGVCEGE